MTNTEISKLEELFLKCKIKKELWTHEAHFVAATCLFFDNSSQDLLPVLRELIRTNNSWMGIENTETSGYHEALTWFYLREIKRILTNKTFGNKFDAVCEVLKSEIVAKDHPLTFYSKELLFSKNARATVVYPIEHSNA